MRIVDVDKAIQGLDALMTGTKDEHLLASLDFAKRFLNIYAKQIPDHMLNTNLYDSEEIHRNCTVQVLKNTVTGEISVGWWEDAPEVQEG